MDAGDKAQLPRSRWGNVDIAGCRAVQPGMGIPHRDGKSNYSEHSEESITMMFRQGNNEYEAFRWGKKNGDRLILTSKKRLKERRSHKAYEVIRTDCTYRLAMGYAKEHGYTLLTSATPTRS